MAAVPASLDPAVLDRLSHLSLVARTVVEGFMAGQHRSPHRGSSVEFVQHREYSPGDELRRVDWKVFARSERLVVKEYVEETNLTCHVLLDASESMDFGSLPWTKLDYARWAAAAMTHLVLSARDTAGLVVFDDEQRVKVPPGNGAAQLKAMIEILEAARPGGPTRIGDVLQWLGPKLPRRGIVAIFSDFFDDIDKIVAGLRMLAHGGHEPILFQVLDPQELSFDFETMVRFDGLEGTGMQKVDPKAIREAYIEEMAAHNEALARHARLLGLDHVTLPTSASLEAAMSTYLAHRQHRARGGRG